MRVRTCIKCNTSKPLDAFYTRSNSAGERVPRGACKACFAEDVRARRAANPDRYNAYNRTYQAKFSRRQRTLRRFGMTLSDWDQMLLGQGGVCAICKGASGDPVLHGDHDHDTDEFRGILCGLCNRMLGQGQDDADRLRAGAAYLDARQKLRAVV